MIICIHIYDDFSGSANVFSQALTALNDGGFPLLPMVGSHGVSGFIRSRHRVGIFKHKVSARTSQLAINLLMVQFRIFTSVVRLCIKHKPQAVYVNTVLPFGAVLGAHVCGVRSVVHVHEVGLGSKTLFKMCWWIMRRFATEFLCVSNYVANTLRIPNRKFSLIYNSLSRDQWAAAEDIRRQRAGKSLNGEFVVVMACSLKIYKGVDSFVQLAHRFRNSICADRAVRFELILNCDASDFDAYLGGLNSLDNLRLIRRPLSVIDHYGSASLVVNLSHVDRCIETFGLTLLEAMACGVPVVCPTVGGCTELFQPGAGGWRIDSKDIDGLEALIRRLCSDPHEWRSAAAAAIESAERFAPERFASQLGSVFRKV